ncbi:MAG: HIRAN domain-containing protein [Lentisphaeria bacterium]
MANDIIPVADWSKMIQAFGKDGVPLPFVKEIFLLECQVAGTSHIDEIEEKTAGLNPGAFLGFLREPANPHDPLAIRILNQQNAKIGYVPRQRNEVIARLMDGGKLIFGKVESKEANGSWLKITITVYMRDF